jgi:ABC-type multidrug transport system ATPase subunit
MKSRVAVIAVAVAAVGLLAAADLAACGEKFLVAGRGTRYQRPKNFRAASVLIYANPSSSLDAALRKLPVESILKREGHRATVVVSPDQLSAILASGKFDVLLADSGEQAAVETLLAKSSDAPALVAVCLKGQEKAAVEKCSLKAPPKERTLLEAIDRAIERHDQNARKVAARS